MLATRNDIEKYIPQRAPFVMVHTLLEADEAHAVSTFNVENENIFLQNGRLLEPALIENIAQTAAAQAGYQYISKNLPVPIGFIAAIRNLKVDALPTLSQTLTT